MKTLKESILGNVGLDKETIISKWFEENTSRDYELRLEVSDDPINGRYLIDIYSEGKNYQKPILKIQSPTIKNLTNDGFFEIRKIDCSLVIDCPNLRTLDGIQNIEFTNGACQQLNIIHGDHIKEVILPKEFGKNSIEWGGYVTLENFNLKDLSFLTPNCTQVRIENSSLKSLKGCHYQMHALALDTVSDLKSFSGGPKICDVLECWALQDITSLQGFPKVIDMVLDFEEVGAFKMADIQKICKIKRIA